MYAHATDCVPHSLIECSLVTVPHRDRCFPKFALLKRASIVSFRPAARNPHNAKTTLCTQVNHILSSNRNTSKGEDQHRSHDTSVPPDINLLHRSASCGTAPAMHNDMNHVSMLQNRALLLVCVPLCACHSLFPCPYTCTSYLRPSSISSCANSVFAGSNTCRNELWMNKFPLLQKRRST